MKTKDYSNNITRLLKTLEHDPEALKRIAPIINWEEKSESLNEDGDKYNTTTRSLIYRHLSEKALIALISDNMMQADYGREKIPFHYALNNNRFDFLDEYYKFYQPTDDDWGYIIKDFQSAFEHCAADAYNTRERSPAFDVSNADGVKKWFESVDKALGLMRKPEQNVIYKMLMPEIEKKLKQQKNSALYLLNKAKPCALSEIQVSYAVQNLDCAHLWHEPQLAHVIQKKLNNVAAHSFYGDSHTSYGSDQQWFYSNVEKIAKPLSHFMKVASTAAQKGLIEINSNLEDKILTGLAQQCPVMFLWARENFPNHLYKGLLSASEVENCYAMGYRLHEHMSGSKVDYQDIKSIDQYFKPTGHRISLHLSEHYNVRRLQFERVGLALPSVKDFKLTHMPNPEHLEVLPGLSSLNHIQPQILDKLSLDLNIQTAAKGSVLKI